MKHLKVVIFFLVLAGSCVGLYGLLMRPAGAQPADVPPGPGGIVIAQKTDVYSAKFLCGSFAGLAAANLERPVKFGNYQTAINLHNPNAGTLTFKKKAVLLFRADQPPTAPELPMAPVERVQKELSADYGMEIDCDDIRKVLLVGAPPAPTFIKGWVVIEVSAIGVQPKPLDVVAAYTAHGFTVDSAGVISPEGFSLEVLPITPKRKS